MDEHDWLAERFEANRAHLRAVAYRMLGSPSEADDAVQECLAPAQPHRRERRREPGRLADDGRVAGVPRHAAVADSRGARSRWTRRRRAGRQTAPATSRGRPRARGAAGRLGRVRRCSSCSRRWLPPSGWRSCCTTCSPCPSTRSPPIVGRSPDAARQLASRARRRVQGRRPSPDADLTRQREIVDAFLAAARGGDFDALVALLDPDVVLRADDAAVRSGARRGPRRDGGGGHVLGPGPGRPAGAGGRRRRTGVGAGRTAEGRLRLHHRRREDREIDLLADPERLGELDVVVLDG